MKLGVANRIVVTDFDLDDTVDSEPKYSDIVAVLLLGDPSSDRVAQYWLDAKGAA